MKSNQFSNRIGNIEDQLIEQAKQMPDFGRIRRKANLRRSVSMVAVLALMMCSFVVGAVALQKTPEIIEMKEVGISLILPDEWAGKYGYEITGNSLGVYHLATRENEEWKDAGYLFWIECLEGQLPMDYVYPGPGFTIASTANYTYALFLPSDVQYDWTDEAASKEYTHLMESRNEIQIVLSSWMAENSSNEGNWISGTVTVQYLEAGEVVNTVTCDPEVSRRMIQIIEEQDYTVEQSSFPTDLMILFSGEEYFVNSTTGRIMSASGGDYSALMSEADLQELLSLLA